MTIVDEPGAGGSPDADTDADTPSQEDILKEAQARIALAMEAETEIRLAALDDLKFIAGEQWPQQVIAERMRENRPCLTVNRLPQFVNQITNDQRQNRPAIKVSPLDKAADQDTADIIQGMIRHIEYNSNAEVAYDTGFESAARGGFGYWRVVTAYSDPESFDQEIYIKRIRNPMSVYLDPYAQEPDGSDAKWGFVIDDYSPDEYRAAFPGSQMASISADWGSIGNNSPGWMIDGKARVAEYYYKDFQEVTIYQLKTGETVREEELAARREAATAAGLDASVVQSRKTKIPVVKHLKINALEILDKTTFPGSFIPIIPCYGAELFIDGKRILESLIRHAKGPQQMLNYMKSAQTETIGLAPRAPWVIAEGQVEGYEDMWAEANTKSHSHLVYKPTSIAAAAVPPPQRQTFEPATQAITQAALQANDDIKGTTGIYEAGSGEEGNEVSGVAIQRRGNQIQTATFHFTDNFKRSLRHTGKILLEIIPYVYDTARAVRIIGSDDQQKVVMINQEHKDESGKPVLYDLSVGKYDVTVDTGPSFQSKRQEAAASMLEFTKAMPQTAQFVADLVAKNQDWPGAQEFSDRLKRALPPAFQDNPSTKDIPPQLIAQMQHQAQMIQNLTQNLNEATKVIETKKLDLEHRERIEILKMKTDAEIQMAKMGSQESMALLKAQLTEMEHRLNFLQMNQPIDAPQDFNPEGADGGNYAGVGHIGGTENLTGGSNPGTPVEGN